MDELLKIAREGYNIKIEYIPFPEAHIMVTVAANLHYPLYGIGGETCAKQIIRENELVDGSIDRIAISAKKCKDILKDQIRKLERGL